MARNAEPAPSDLGGLLDLLVEGLGGLCSLVIFAWAASKALTPGFVSEFINHSRLIVNLQSLGVPPYSLWYFLQKTITGSDHREQVLVASGLLLLGGMALLKGVVYTALLRISRLQRLTCLLGGILLGTAVALPIPWVQRLSPVVQGPTLYLGTIPANTFMSSTQLVANIGAVLAFYGLQRWARWPTGASFGMMILTALLATLAKPGISLPILTGIVASIALCCWQQRALGPASLWQLAISTALLLTPAIVIRHFFFSGAGWLKTKAVLAPLETWHQFSAQIPIDLIASYAFPGLTLALLLLHFRQRQSWREQSLSLLRGLLPCWIAALAALLIFVLFAEQSQGQFQYSGNFGWGAISANAGLHFASFIALFEMPTIGYRIPALMVLLAESVGGFNWISHYAATGSFL